MVSEKPAEQKVEFDTRRPSIVKITVIPELLERVLLEVPAIELILSCRRVCKTWRDLIDTTSPQLKRYSTSGLGEYEDDDPNHKSEILTPLAIQVLGMFWKTLARELIVWKPRKEQSHQRHHRRNRVAEKILCYTDDEESEDPFGGSNGKACYRLFCYCVALPVYLPVTLFEMFVYDKVAEKCVEKSRTRMMQKRQRTIQKIFDRFAPIASKLRIFRKEETANSNFVCDGLRRCGRLYYSYWWDQRLEISNANDRIPASTFKIMMYLGESIHKAILDGDPNSKGAEFLLLTLTYRSGSVGEESGDIAAGSLERTLVEELRWKLRAPYALEVGKPGLDYGID
ncbi:hypothetical protein TWF694_002575 [Orbilia ellipsospora]|uniref:F-box domain-containing protein n=1 Tax=Orbilia ellipsospora TaxID=2528407 RepID=A0AAV9X2I0_9PEZI